MKHDDFKKEKSYNCYITLQMVYYPQKVQRIHNGARLETRLGSAAIALKRTREESAKFGVHVFKFLLVLLVVEVGSCGCPAVEPTPQFSLNI